MVNFQIDVDVHKDVNEKDERGGVEADAAMNAMAPSPRCGCRPAAPHPRPQTPVSGCVPRL